MSSCSKTLGGAVPDQDTSEAITSHHLRSKKARTGSPPPTSSKLLNTNPYKSRLRPRPTRQTSHFVSSSPVQSKSSIKRASDCGPSGSNSKTKKPDVTFGRPSAKPGTKPASVKSDPAKKLPVSKVKLSAYSRPTPGHHRSPSCSEPPEKKLASNFGASGEAPEGFTEGPSTSKSLSGGKVHGSKGSSASKKSKVESKSHQLLKKQPTSAKRAVSRKGVLTTTTKTSSSKTGSCASSRRGSERGKRSSAAATASGSSDRPSPPDDANSRTADNNQSSVRARHPQEARAQSSSLPENGETETSSGSRTQAGGGTAASSMDAATSSNNGDSEDADMTRLQQLLEARGLPPHFFGNLGPRMQQILHRSVGCGVNSKAQQHLQGLQAVGDESRQLQAAIGMCQLLVMGNEDTLAGFPIKSAVPALINLLRMEHNFDLMNHACRALTYMMEALPRSSAVIVDAIPVFLEKLQVIQCMDVAEQSLTALEMLSRRHAPAILTAGGQSACLLYIDFFSLPAQRSALLVAANCCLAVGTMSLDPSGAADEFERLVKSSLPLLSSRLTHHDKKCVESACLCFVRLIDNYQQDADILAEIAGSNLFKNFQQLLVITPPLISSGTFVMVIRSMAVTCATVRSIANDLVKDNIAQTLLYLLCGSPPEKDTGQIELSHRSPQELFEITSLVGKLLPRLPKRDALFSINGVLWQNDGLFSDEKSPNRGYANWQWKDDDGQWRPYIRHDSKIIEAAHLAGEHEVNLTTLDRSYTVDFETMQQINDDTGTTRGIRRVLSKPNPSGSSRKSSKKQDATKDKQEEEQEPVTPEISDFIRTLFATLYEVYSSSAGSFAIRYECLHAIQRMVFCAEATLLSDVLQNLSMSSHISSMLSSPDVKVIVGALQLAEMLMKKLPKIFAEMFQREGVLHQLRKLTDPTHPVVGVNRKAASANASENLLGADPESPLSATSPASNSSANRRVSPPLTKAKAFAAALTAKDTPSGAKKKTSRSSRGARSSTSSFFSGLNPTKWGRSASSSSNEAGNSEGPDASDAHKTKMKNSSKMEGNSHGPSKLKSGRYKEDGANTGEINTWIQDRASKFLENYFTRNADNNNKQVGVLQRLTAVAKALQGPDATTQKSGLEDLKSLVGSVDVSSFELQHSGLVTSLLHYLASTTSVDQEGAKKDQGSTQQDCETAASPKAVTFATDLYSRIRLFLSVFAVLPTDFLGKPEDAVMRIDPDQVMPLLNLVRKLSQCVGQLEQFPVKTHDLVSGGSQMLRVLSTRQLKCQLQRHPDCLKVKQWLGGPVKVDPLVQVQAIERYLLARGYGVKASRASMSDVGKRLELAMLQDQDDDSGDEIQDDDDDELSFEDNASECANSGAESSSMAFGYHMERHGRKASAGSLHTLEFYIGNNRLPHHITVLQAVEQYESSANPSSAGDEHDFAFKISENSGVWNKTHVIHYKLVPSKDEAPHTVKGNGKQKSSKKLKSVSKAGRVPAKQHKPSDQSWTEGILPVRQKCLDEYLVTKLPPEFTTPDACSEVLCLLRVIHAISRYWGDVYSSNMVYVDRQLVSSSEFINAKINAKCSRQSQDPLIIITGQLPTWLREVALACPFLLSFETRQQLFKITAFDRDRALQHLLDSGASQELSNVLSGGPNAGNGRAHGSSRFMPRLEKKKCSVSRKNLLQQAERIISDYAHLRAVVEVDYEGEVGTGLGPTLEFFTLTSKELQKASLNMWREELVAGQEPASHKEEVYPASKQKVEGAESAAVVFKMTDKDELIIEESASSSDAKSPDGGMEKEGKDLINSPMGLFPKPLGRAAKLGQVGRINAKFRFLGKFLAKALMDGRMVDLPLSVAFYKWLLGGDLSFTDTDLRHVDPNFASTFDKLKAVAQEYDCLKDSDPNAAESVTMDGCPIEDLGFDMRLPGYAGVELIKLGRNIPVTIHNLDRYLKLIVHWTLVEGVRRQMEALKEGFESVLPLHNLKFFFPEELDQFFCGCRYEPWNVKDLRDACHPDHGYTQDSVSVQRLYHILSTYDLRQQRGFLQFVTGCPRLPVGGFGALNPRLTIVRKNCEEGENIDDYLPSVMTCLNYLKLPDYSTEDVMRSKLELAAVEGLNSFLLS